MMIYSLDELEENYHTRLTLALHFYDNAIEEAVQACLRYSHNPNEETDFEQEQYSALVYERRDNVDYIVACRALDTRTGYKPPTP
jgi:hypothetical protein